MLNMFRMLIDPSSGACDLFVELFHGLYCSGSMCVGVMLWFGCGGMVSVCSCTSACIRIPYHHSQTRNKASDIKLVSLFSIQDYVLTNEPITS